MRYLTIVFASALCIVLISHNPFSIAGATSEKYGQFTGAWSHHDGRISVQANGYGVDHFRTFVQCTANVTTNCDEWKGNVIYAGGFTAFTLNRVVGNKAYGSVYNASASWLVGVKVTLVRHTNDTVTLLAPSGSETGCDSKASAESCGA